MVNYLSLFLWFDCDIIFSLFAVGLEVLNARCGLKSKFRTMHIDMNLFALRFLCWFYFFRVPFLKVRLQYASLSISGE